ncbi:MAG TPA: hypothetical protein VFB21_07905 [Chthonomonadaceae bacterium]|nr:hypothetical protein [Chthonomonadaceae bacterium]
MNVKLNPVVGVLIVLLFLGIVFAAMWFSSEAPKSDKPALPPWIDKGVQERLKKADQAKAAAKRPAGIPEKPAGKSGEQEAAKGAGNGSEK